MAKEGPSATSLRLDSDKFDPSPDHAPGFSKLAPFFPSRLIYFRFYVARRAGLMIVREGTFGKP